VKISAFLSTRLAWLLGGIGSLIILLWLVLALLFFLEPAELIKIDAKPIKTENSSALETARDNYSIPPPEDLRSAETITTSSAARPPEPIEEPWQQAIHAILQNDGSPAQLSGRLAATLPGMPLEGQLEAAQHMVNLLADEEYATAETVYLNPAMPESVRRLVFEDFMNRPNSLKLPLLVRTLRETGNPFRNEAMENLQVYIGRDEGEDWSRWDAAVRETLERERREQEAAQGGGS
jgi:hypothetical protein